MPKNKGTGGKKRRKGRSNNDSLSQEITQKCDGQEYGQIMKPLGNGFMEVMCFTSDGNILRRAHIRGKMRKRAWMASGDIVLVNVRNFQESTCDIVLKYNLTEARTLRSKQLIPDNIDINNLDANSSNDPFAFGDDNNNNVDNNDTIVTKQENRYDMPNSESGSEPESESGSESDSDEKVDLNKLL